MEKQPFIIITCSKCQVKNRVVSYQADKIPICAKCKTPLVDESENEVHSRYGKKLDEFNNLPDIGLR